MADRPQVYFSGSITGANPDQELSFSVVQFLLQKNCDVLSEHLTARNPEELRSLLLKRTGVDKEALSENEYAKFIRKIDTEWVDQATHLVVVITGPSLGVGMEIERALLKPERGLRFTPILCLVPEESLNATSRMVRGIAQEGFVLRTYRDRAEIEKHIDEFLPR